MKKPSVYVGVDLGMRNTGLCIGTPAGKILKLHVIETKKSDYRLKSHQLWYESYGLIRNLNYKISNASLIGVELPHGGVRGNNATALRLMSAAVGLFAAITVQHRRQPPVILCTPNDVKKHIRPKGPVSKDEIISYCKNAYPELVWPKKTSLHEHAADAIVVFELLLLKQRAGKA